jgi:ADP-heptose:LPS heptosyltransferase
MKEYLIFRTDRVGDFLLSLSLIKIIKINHPDSKITVVASEKNVNYIKTFEVVNNVIVLKNNFISKLKIFFNLRKEKYEAIIVHDGKNRSRLISYFLNFKKRIVCINNLIDTQLDIIRKACIIMQLNFDLECLNFLDNRNHNLVDIPFKNYIHLHFDEKWEYNEYIKKYTNIEPDENELIHFINSIISKNKNLVITTGKKASSILKYIKNKVNKDRVQIYSNQSLLEIENIVFNSDLLITCHGWISHIASSKKIKQIDIIDDLYPYHKWTSHFRNYNYINREAFKSLTKKIIKLI